MMKNFKDFCEEQFNYTYVPLDTTTNLYIDILNDYIEAYEGFLDDEDIELLKSEAKKDTTTFKSFLEQLSSYVKDYHVKIRPEDFDYRLERTPIEKLTEDEQMFLYNHSDVYESISNINEIIFDTRLLFDFSTINKIHMAKKKIRKILSSHLGREIKSWEMDKIATISDLRNCYEGKLDFSEEMGQ